MAGRYFKNSRLVIHFWLLLSIFIISTPVVFALIVSTQSPVEVFSYPPKLTPGTQFSNYVEVWQTVPLGKMLFNSLLVTVLVTFGKLVISLLAAFAFTYFQFPGKSIIFFLTLVTLMLPIPVRIVPLFELIADLGKTVSPHLGVDSYFALIVPFLASATGTFLFRQHFLTVPTEFVDAARIDGCGPMRFLFLVLLPLSWNTVGAMVVIQFVYVWNQYLWPLVATQSEGMRVVQIGVKMLIDSESANNWGVIMAGVTMAMLPPLLVFFLLQESFLRGFAFSRDK
ncbi:MAG: carbohydrate ABC transporter permease [bacterium]